MNAIETLALTKRYGKVTAVDRLDLTVAEGELFALLGVNGAGKTTTIKMLSCLSRPTSGDALLGGNSIVKAPEKVKQIIGISPQETAVAPNLTVRENIKLIAGIYGAEHTEADRLTESIIGDFSLGECADAKAKTLSGGWQRRLSIAMALVSRPRILFLDEPTLGLDVLARRELWGQILRLKGKVTIVLTTHYLEEVEALSDRVGVMTRGRLTAVGSVAELKELTGKDSLEDAFVEISAKAGENTGKEAERK